MHLSDTTSAFPVALVVAVKAGLTLERHRAASGRLDAKAIAEDMLRRRPDLNPVLVEVAVASRLGEDPMHQLA